MVLSDVLNQAVPDVGVALLNSTRELDKSVRLVLNTTDTPTVHTRNWVIDGLLVRVLVAVG